MNDDQDHIVHPIEGMGFSSLTNLEIMCCVHPVLFFLVMLKKFNPSLNSLKMKSFRRTKKISSLAFALIIQCFTVLFKLIIFKLIRLKFNLFNVTNMLCALSCLSSSVAKVTALVSFILLMKSLESFSDTSLV